MPRPSPTRPRARAVLRRVGEEAREGGREGEDLGRGPVVPWVPTAPGVGPGPVTDPTVRGAVGVPGWLSVPEGLRGSRVTPPLRAAGGVLVLLLVVALVFGGKLLWARLEDDPAGGMVGPPVAPTGVTTGRPVLGVTPTRSGPDAGAGGLLAVHVVGAVRRPGVVRLPAGSRVIDAVTAAGGPAPGADLSLVNLARVLLDGEQVRVLLRGEAPGPGGAGGSAGAGSGVPGTGGPGGPGAAGAGSVSLNTADLAALDSLPGVGPVLAQRILDWRAEHGRFTSIDELGEVSGIGDKLLSQLRSKVTL